MVKPVVDVIVPVYNGEPFVKTIIDTFEGQTFKDFKVIFVDDGSTDNSLAALQEALTQASFPYAVVHQENGGASKARNTGIQKADAQWITFVDCDDKLDARFLEYLYRSVTEHNTVLGYCGFQGVPFQEQDKIVPVGEYDGEVISAEECMKRFYTKWISPCCLMFNREWFLSNDLFFDEQCTYCEDIPFITTLIAAADTVSALHNDTYFYLLREGSSIRSPKMEKYQNGIEAFWRMADRVEKQDSAAATVFRRVGKARYMLATLRKGAVQLPFEKFKRLTSLIETETFKEQIRNLSSSHKVAGYLYLVSKTLFYYGMRSLFKD